MISKTTKEKLDDYIKTIVSADKEMLIRNTIIWYRDEIWRNAEDEKPENDKEVVCITPDKRVFLARLSNVEEKVIFWAYKEDVLPSIYKFEKLLKTKTYD